MLTGLLKIVDQIFMKFYEMIKIVVESHNENYNVVYSIYQNISEYDYSRRTDSFKDIYRACQ